MTKRLSGVTILGGRRMRRLALGLAQVVVVVTIVATGVAAIVVTTDSSRVAAESPTLVPSDAPPSSRAPLALDHVTGPVTAPTTNPEAFGDGRVKASDWVVVEFPPKPAAVQSGGGGGSTIFGDSMLWASVTRGILELNAVVFCYGTGTVSGTVTVKSESQTQTVKLSSLECRPRRSGACFWKEWISVPAGDSKLRLSMTVTHSSGATLTKSASSSI
jgi:hypothetical protein